MKSAIATLFVFVIFATSVVSAQQNQLPTFKEPFLVQPNVSFFYYAGPWAAGAPNLNGWVPQLVSVGPNGLQMTCSDVACPEGCSYMPYACGSLQTLGTATYGYYESEFKCPNVTGTDCSFFLYAEDGAPHYNRYNEIDIEILGINLTQVQFNWWVNNTAHPAKIDLGFDASVDFHVYGIGVSAQTITFYVDGKLAYTFAGDFSILKPMQIFTTYWPCKADGWCSEPGREFTYTGPSMAEYRYIAFTNPSDL